MQIKPPELSQHKNEYTQDSSRSSLIPGTFKWKTNPNNAEYCACSSATANTIMHNSLTFGSETFRLISSEMK